MRVRNLKFNITLSLIQAAVRRRTGGRRDDVVLRRSIQGWSSHRLRHQGGHRTCHRALGLRDSMRLRCEEINASEI